MDPPARARARRLTAAAAFLLVGAALAGCDAAAVPATRPLNSPAFGASVAPGGTLPVPRTPRPTAEPVVSTPGTSAEPSTVLGEAPLGPTETALVVRVVDGDTIVIDRGYGEETVRYIGINTPETVAPGSPVEWMGPEASAANKRLVEGREVILERDVSETDRYGRLLRYVWFVDTTRPTGWLFVNLDLVANGFAQVSTYPPDVRYAELYFRAQALAREAEVGLWGAEPEPTLDAQPTDKPEPNGDCDHAYPTVCIAPTPPDLDCGDVPYRRFTVLPPDPHRFDGDHDGIGCES